VSELLIMIDGNLIGRVRADKAGRLSLDYEANWLESPHGHSLSVSMPLGQITYPHKAVLSYLWNLLPENPHVLQRWGSSIMFLPQIHSSYWRMSGPMCRVLRNSFLRSG